MGGRSKHHLRHFKGDRTGIVFGKGLDATAAAAHTAAVL